MKTKINDTYIDLRQVAVIGPLSAEGNREQRRYGFVLNLGRVPGEFGSSGIWIAAVPDVLDNHSIDSTHNDAIKAKAKAAYDAFVAEWKAVP